jgi:hypothetical protein
LVAAPKLAAGELSRLVASLGRRRRDEASLDLAVTVRAHEDALPRLGSIGIERLASCDGDPEGLLLRHHVVEVEVHDAAVVAANRTASSPLSDK